MEEIDERVRIEKSDCPAEGSRTRSDFWKSGFGKQSDQDLFDLMR